MLKHFQMTGPGIKISKLFRFSLFAKHGKTKQNKKKPMNRIYIDSSIMNEILIKFYSIMQ